MRLRLAEVRFLSLVSASNSGREAIGPRHAFFECRKRKGSGNIDGSK